jgi:ribonuclease D
MPSAELHVTVADDPRTLRAALADLDGLSMVGVDVERADSDRYWRAAALIQVGGEDRVALVDPLRIDDLTALREFLHARVTILHAMDNDLSPLDSAGTDPGRVEDTAIAAAVLGLPTGLGDLLEGQLGIDLTGDKQSMQRADWAARPLTEKMIAYAADDVAHLPRLWTELASQLADADRDGWYVEERDWVRGQPTAEARRHWTRTRGVGRLDAHARSRARSLWETRERLARDTDTAPGRILADRTLVDLATRPVDGPRELGRRGVRRAAVRRFGTELVDALDEPGEIDRAAARRRMTDEGRALVDQLRLLRSARAKELGMDPGVLCPNRVLGAAVLAEPRTPSELRGALGLRRWQWEQIGAAFCEALEIEGPGKPPPTSMPTATSIPPPDAATGPTDAKGPQE